ncbi:CGNR zinc finger domain-containing protein [Nonomuraea spiralis]|uniref:CGNR zinc finger domain-containing protein n=1 Tax=Nonomuraea spiralis TaxID=46182 RepID=UPI00379380C7
MRIRPLRDEPLALDLVDTVWVDQGALLDQFDDLEGVRAWLGDHGLPGADDLERVRDRLVLARDALRGLLEGRGHDRLNAVLDEGATRPRFGDDGPRDTVVVSDPAWEAAWTAAAAVVPLLRERPERLRKCANPSCVLWFLDVSKNGSRRWCSMEVCGNRAKAGRFSRRHKSAG